MAEGLVLHSPPALIELAVGQLYEVERVGDLDRVGQHRVEHRSVRAGQVQRGPLHLGAPLLAPLGEPLARPGGAATRDNVKQAATVDVDDRGGPVLPVPRSPPHEQRLIQPESGHGPHPARVVVDQSSAVRDDGVVDRVPVTAQLDGDVVDGPPVPSDLLGHPPPRPVRHRQPCRADPRVLTGPRPDRAGLSWAAPAVLAPPQPHRATERGQVDQFHHWAVLDPHRSAAPVAGRPLASPFDVNLEWVLPVAGHDPEDGDVGQANEQLADASRVNFHRGSPESDRLRHRQIRRAPVPRPGCSAADPARFRSAAFVRSDPEGDQDPVAFTSSGGGRTAR
jgi:hypothetical protein